MANIELFRRIISHARQHPEEYDQTRYRAQRTCGTTYCIAGHAVIMTHGEVQMLTYDDRLNLGRFADFRLPDGRYGDWMGTGAKALGLTIYQAEVVFSANNSLERVERMVDLLAWNPDADAEDLYCV